MLEDRGNNKYSWFDDDKISVYILPSYIGNSFDLEDHETWLPSDQLTPAGVLPNSEDNEQEEEDNDEIPKAEHHFDRQPQMQ